MEMEKIEIRQRLVSFATESTDHIPSELQTDARKFITYVCYKLISSTCVLLFVNINPLLARPISQISGKIGSAEPPQKIHRHWHRS